MGFIRPTNGTPPPEKQHNTDAPDERRLIREDDGPNPHPRRTGQKDRTCAGVDDATGSTHCQILQTVHKKYPTIRQHSEIPDVAVEVSLQPYRNYNTDGCILFSDILTPLPGLGVELEFNEKVGPVVSPMKTWDGIKKMSPIDPSSAASFMAQALHTLREEVSLEMVVLGFVGCPYTLATYKGLSQNQEDGIQGTKIVA